MQLRVAGCVLIVAIVRVLNLAVPVLYRNAINKLAETTNLTHPRPGDKPLYPSFFNVCFIPASCCTGLYFLNCSRSLDLTYIQFILQQKFYAELHLI